MHLNFLKRKIFFRVQYTSLNNTFRQGMAPVLEMAMVAKLLMILIDTTMMWDVPKKRPDKLHHGKVAVYSA